MNHLIKTMTKNKWLRFSLIFVLMLMVSEFFLFSIGWSLTFFKKPTIRNKLTKEHSQGATQRKTIITLGESTTADGGSFGAESWPQILQKKMIQENKSYNIVNLAKIGVVSTNLVQKFLDRYKTLKPDLVITMMGRGDTTNPTSDNFNRLSNFLENRGVCLIVMQYPLLEIKEMKKYFLNHRSPYLFFVENKINFEKLLIDYKYEDIFSDRFAGKFGHSKQLGNELIAESILPVIKNALNQPHCQNPQWQN